MPEGSSGRVWRELWSDVWLWDDPISRDLGVAGELLVAKARLALVLLLALIPAKSVLLDPTQRDHWIGLGAAAAALLFALLILALAKRAEPPAWLGMASSQFDVGVISLGAIGFVLAGDPLTATNSLVHYTVYFIALAGTCLRHDPRICLAAGMS